MNLKEIRTQIERSKGQREEVENRIDELQSTINTVEKEIVFSEKAQAIIQKVAQETQQQLEYHISDIVSLALDTIFEDPYQFTVEFVVRRNKTECELVFKRDGERISPLSASGGGVVDVASFALRIALWTLQNPKSRNTLILDEPFKFLSKDLLPRACDLLQELRDRLSLQFIIVTHLDELALCADKTFEVRLKKGVSVIHS
jgi:DNA repair exonuclease SbcCD ATPase subunit|tara:strand:+ start:576 stop:1181 length:606 start_codon:yes stop_codon:yes gene_type:complete